MCGQPDRSATKYIIMYTFTYHNANSYTIVLVRLAQEYEYLVYRNVYCRNVLHKYRILSIFDILVSF